MQKALTYATAVVVITLHQHEGDNRWILQEWSMVWVLKAYLTSGRCWSLPCRCRSRWRAGTRSPSRRWRSASSATPGWACAACRTRSWSSTPRGEAGSRSHSPCWCCTQVSSLCCNPSGSVRMGEKAELKRRCNKGLCFPEKLANVINHRSHPAIIHLLIKWMSKRQLHENFMWILHCEHVIEHTSLS